MRRIAGAALFFAVFVSSLAAQAPPPRITKGSGGRPNWVDKPDSAYNKAYYIAAVGYGSSRQQADSSAFGNLAGFFGQSIESKHEVVEHYKERFSGGALKAESETAAAEAVARTSSLSELIGAEINDRWEDAANRVFYAVAVLEKPRAVHIYTELFNDNLALIENALAGVGSAGVFDDIGRFYYAAGIADANAVFARVLSGLGAPVRTSGLSGGGYRQEAAKAAREVGIKVNVKNDSAGKIASAFHFAFNSTGFSTISDDGRYELDAKIELAPVEYPGNQNKYTRFVLDARLVDKKNKEEIFSYHISGREGHIIQREADERAIKSAESMIKTGFAAALEENLSASFAGNQKRR
ncbi:MAG: LPP20 family lipoprotein [Spirochaetaceae bacterium]|nr:LPP20 family lipoprotein [Spirochaetaceae bacterium]